MSETLYRLPLDSAPGSGSGRGPGKGRGRGRGRAGPSAVRCIRMETTAPPEPARWKGSCVLVPGPGETAGLCPKGKVEPCPPEVWPRCEAQRNRMTARGDI